MRQGHDRLPKGFLILGIMFGVLASAAPAMAGRIVPVPEPGTLTLLAISGGVAGAIALGRNWRKRRDVRRRGDDR